jgi:hypothetical protein
MRFLYFNLFPATPRMTAGPFSVRHFAVVVTEVEFAQVPMQVLTANVVVRSVDPTLEQ